MARSQFTLRSLFAVTCLVALASGFIHQAGIEVAANCWCGPITFAAMVWLMARVPSETRGRIRLIAVVVGAIVGVSLAGLLSVWLCTLTPAAIADPGLWGLYHRDTDVVHTWTLIGGVVGLFLALLGSWIFTSGGLTSHNKPNNEQPQRAPSANQPVG